MAKGNQGSKRKGSSPTRAAKKSKSSKASASAPVPTGSSKSFQCRTTVVSEEEDAASLGDSIIIEVDADGKEKAPPNSAPESEAEDSEAKLGQTACCLKGQTNCQIPSTTPEGMVLTNLWLLQACPTDRICRRPTMPHIFVRSEELLP